MCEVEVIKVLGGVNDSGIAHSLAVVIDENVAHYREHPSFEVDIFGVFVFAVKNLESGVLHKIIGVITIRSEDECETEQIILYGE